MNRLLDGLSLSSLFYVPLKYLDRSSRLGPLRDLALEGVGVHDRSFPLLGPRPFRVL